MSVMAILHQLTSQGLVITSVPDKGSRQNA